MSADGDYDDEMKRRPDIDPSTADRLLGGDMAPADAPPSFEGVARLFLSASTTAPAEAEPRLLAAMADAVSTPTRTPVTARRHTVISKLIASKLAAAGLVGGIVLSGGVAVAATGNMGDAAQDFLSEAAAKVGFDLPASDRSERGRSTAEDVKGAEHDAHETPAADEGKGAEVSDTARNTESTGVDKGAEVSTTASDGHSRAGTAPAPATGAGSSGSAPVDTPNSGGTSTGDGASSGASSTGTGTADEWSDGRSSVGASNAPAPEDRPTHP